MKFIPSEVIKTAEKEFGLGAGKFFKPKEGSNSFRIMSNGVPHQNVYQGKTKSRFVIWIYDNADELVKLYFMPPSIMDALESLCMTPGYEFDEAPLPYDVTLSAKGAGTKEVKYQLTGARSNTPVSEDAVSQMEGKKTVEEVVEKLKEKDAQSTAEGVQASSSELQEPTEGDVNLADIPFA